MATWLVTGGHGMLGTALTRTLRDHGHTVHDQRRDITEKEWWRPGNDQQVDVVVNCAAATDVDRCEQQPVYAYLANAVGAGHVAAVCAQRGIPLVHVSTDHVFPGSDRVTYHEQSPRSPVNVYGWSKAAGEDIVRGMHPQAVVVRTAWLHDGPRPMPSGRPTFASWISGLTADEQALPYQVGHPTWVGAVAARLMALGGRMVAGLPDGAERVYHAVSTRHVTKVRYAAMVAELAGVRTRFVTAPDTDVRVGARRPVNVTMSQLAWDGIGLPPMPSVDVQLKEAFA